MKTYTEEFKLKMVQLYNAGKSARSLCDEFDLKIQTLYAWIKRYNTVDSEILAEKPQISAFEIEIIELKKLLAEKDMELDILKQAALIMGRKK
jgi:transposase